MADNIEGKNILLVEDDDLVAFTVEDILLYAKAGSVAIVPTVSKALQLLGDRNFDVAIVDINLKGEASWPVARELRRLGIPYLTVTGYGDLLENELVGALLSKPYSMQQLLSAVTALVQ